MASSLAAHELTHIPSLPRLTINQRPEPGKTNSKFSVPQVIWKFKHNNTAAPIGQADTVAIHDNN